MILDFKVKNFCSFKDEANFSLLPAKVPERFQNNVINIENKLKISNMAVIVGENAGGKTSFITALHFFKSMITHDAKVATYSNLAYGYDLSKPQSFELSALIDENIYTYSLIIDSYSLLQERLALRKYTQKPGSDSIIFSSERLSLNNSVEDDLINVSFERTLSDKYIDSKIVNLLKQVDNDSNDDPLLLNLLGKLNVPIVKPFLNWILHDLIVEIPSDFSINIYKSMQKNEEDLKILTQDSFLEIFKLVDSAITHIEIDSKDPYKDTKIFRKRNDGSILSIKLKDDSSGVKAFFAWSVQIWKVIYNNATLFADEMDHVLNVVLSSKIVNFIKLHNTKGQFIFSTHNIFHLNTIDYMKYQLFFISKDPEELSSSLYSLADFKEYRYDQPEVYTLYLKGLLGAVPND